MEEAHTIDLKIHTAIKRFGNGKSTEDTSCNGSLSWKVERLTKGPSEFKGSSLYRGSLYFIPSLKDELPVLELKLLRGKRRSLVLGVLT